MTIADPAMDLSHKSTAKGAHDIDARVRAHIEGTLRRVADAHGVRILYAAESGSRAWGFGSPDVKLKKYLYVVRPLLSLQAVINDGGPPPMQIESLLATADIPHDVDEAIEELLATKRSIPELGVGLRIPAIDDWASSAIERLAPERLSLSNEPRVDGRAAANELFRGTVGFGAV